MRIQTVMQLAFKKAKTIRTRNAGKHVLRKRRASVIVKQLGDAKALTQPRFLDDEEGEKSLWYNEGFNTYHLEETTDFDPEVGKPKTRFEKLLDKYRLVRDNTVEEYIDNAVERMLKVELFDGISHKPLRINIMRTIHGDIYV